MSEKEKIQTAIIVLQEKIIDELRQMMSYLGYLNGTNVYNAYLEYIKPFFDFGKAKKRISDFDRRNSHELI